MSRRHIIRRHSCIVFTSTTTFEKWKPPSYFGDKCSSQKKRFFLGGKKCLALHQVSLFSCLSARSNELDPLQIAILVQRQNEKLVLRVHRKPEKVLSVCRPKQTKTSLNKSCKFVNVWKETRQFLGYTSVVPASTPTKIQARGSSYFWSIWIEFSIISKKQFLTMRRKKTVTGSVRCRLQFNTLQMPKEFNFQLFLEPFYAFRPKQGPESIESLW